MLLHHYSNTVSPCIAPTAIGRATITTQEKYMAAKTATDKIAELRAEYEGKIKALKDEASAELLVKIREKRRELQELEQQYSELTGKSIAQAAGGGKRGNRIRISIGDVVAAIKGGATNYRKIAEQLGCSPANVANKIKDEGKAAGIKSKGKKAAFVLFI